MRPHELVCLAIVALYVVARLRGEPRPLAILRRLALLGAAAVVGETSMIRAYAFYGYGDAWSIHVDRVPLLVGLIWPVVIHSAWDLARAAAPGSRAPLAGAAIVLADASLVEPVAVRASLWSWNAPGLFSVPPIGVLGWSFFTLACLSLLEEGERRGRPARFEVAAVALAPLATHALVLAAWWGGLRLASRDLPAAPCVALAWALGLSLAFALGRARVGERIPRARVLVRVPAAAFFFVLLARAELDVELVLFALAFVPPWLAVLLRST